MNCRYVELAMSIESRKRWTCGWPYINGRKTCQSRHGTPLRWVAYELRELYRLFR